MAVLIYFAFEPSTPKDRLPRWRSFNLSAIASGCGFENSVAVSSQNELADVLPRLREGPGMQFASIKVRAEKLGFSLPPKDGVYLKTRFRKAILGDAAVSST
jgi:hypothetical protein